MRYLPVLVLLLLSGCLFFGRGDVVEKGDHVEIDFTGTLQDTGEVFETTYRDVALNPNVKKTDWFTFSEEYAPLTFVVGESQLLTALEEGVIGMGVGDTKDILLTADEAYGNWSSDYVISMPRTASMPRYYNMSTPLFTGSFGKEPALGDIFPLMYNWTALVLEVYDEDVLVMFDSGEQDTIETEYGQADVSMNSSHIITYLNPKIGTIVKTKRGTGTIRGTDENNVYIDMNHPLAGKAIAFNVTVVKIVKGGQT